MPVTEIKGIPIEEVFKIAGQENLTKGQVKNAELILEQFGDGHQFVKVTIKAKRDEIAQTEAVSMLAAILEKNPDENEVNMHGFATDTWGGDYRFYDVIFYQGAPIEQLAAESTF